MKKVLISIGSILIMAFVVVLFINASESKNNTTKVKNEVTKEKTAAPCSADCNNSKAVIAATCDPEACKEMKCSNKDSKCDPATCPKHLESQPKEGKVCGSSSGCKVMCPSETVKSN